MENTCPCLTSIRDNGDTIYVCMNYKCHKEESERLECLVTQTKSSRCTFLKNGKCHRYINLNTCTLATDNECILYETKQDYWRELMRAQDEMGTNRPSWSDYSKSHITGKVVSMDLTELEKGKKYEIVMHLKEDKSITTYAPNVFKMVDFYSAAINQYVWYEDGKLAIIQDEYFGMNKKDIKSLLECLTW